MLRFDIITLFPKMFNSPFAESIISRAQKEGKIEIETHQLRDYALDKHKTTDDTPYGGGPGMVIKVDVVDRAIAQVKRKKVKGKRRIVMLSASGERFTQKKAIELSKYDSIVLLCGHYEGFDYRVHEHLIDEEISIGDYVLTGGEIPAMVVIDAVTRMIPGAIKEESIINESFMPFTLLCHSGLACPPNWRDPESRNKRTSVENKKILKQVQDDNLNGDNNKLLATDYSLLTNYDYPVYTRPVEYKGWRVPEVLQSGNHAEIDKWRNDQIKKEKPDSY